MKKRWIVSLVVVALIFLFIYSNGGFNKAFTGRFVLDFFMDPMDIIYSAGYVFIDIFIEITVDSPQNTTYNFNPGDDYIIDLNVSLMRTADTWWYNLIDLKNNVVVNDTVIFIPNTTIYAVRWSNEIIVFANDSAGNIMNGSVVFYVNVSNSAPVIENLSTQIHVCEGGSLSYFFNVSDIDQDTPTVSLSPQFPSNPFYIHFSNNVNSTSNMYEIYSGILSKSDAGGVNAGSKNYSVNVSVADDSNSDSGSSNITVIEINNAPVFETIGVKTVWLTGDNSSFNYATQVSDTESGDQDSGNLSFNVSFSGDELFNISSTGVMNYTPNSSHIGVHNVTICVSDWALDNPHENISLCNQDGGNQTSCHTFSLTVTNTNRPPNITSNFPVNLSFSVNEGQTTIFNVSEYDPDGTIPDTYWYLDDVLVEIDTGSLIDNLSYTWSYSSAGYHNITVKVTDGNLSSSFDIITWNITVIDVTVSTSAGGGGGGGGGGGVCIEKWGCEAWSECKSIEKGIGFLDNDLIEKIRLSCSFLDLNEKECGFQERSCVDLNNCTTSLKKPVFEQSCYYTAFPTCSDNIKNCHNGDCEVLTDCGGPCPACPTCSDGILNQGEEKVDCGGPCNACFEFPEKIEGTPESIILYLAITLILIVIILLLIYLRYKYTFEKLIEIRRLKYYK